MLDKIKFNVFVWGTAFLLISLFVMVVLWVICSLWWLITNNMVDRNIFLLMSLGVTKLISLSVLGLSLLPEKK